MGANNATSAYAKVGLYPFNPLADSWENAIDTLGLDKELDMRRVVTKNFEIKVITTEEGRPSLSQEEEDAILTGWKFHNQENEVPTAEASTDVLLIAKLRGDSILGRWRETKDNLMRNSKYDDAEKLLPKDIVITNDGDKAALKLIKFVEATDELPLPADLSKEEERIQTTFNILNNTKVGIGVVQVEILNNKDNDVEILPFPSSDVIAVKGSCDALAELDNKTGEFCCSGYDHCKLKKCADPKIHACPICMKGVHSICGVVNPDFANDKVGFRFSTICMKCHISTIKKDVPQNKVSLTSAPTKKEIGIAYKRPDGQWCVCVSTREPMIVTHNDLMDITKYFITNVGLTQTEADVKRQSRRMKRERKKEEVKHQRAAKIIAEKKRVEWLKENYLDFV